MAVKLIDEFVNDPDVEFYSVHWDSKKVELADGTKEERFVVCLKPIDADKPAQFIAAPRTPDGTGLSAKNATVRVLVQHGIPLPKVKLMGFDTTASNSGRKMGAAVRIEDHISGENGGEPLLYGGCRRHSAERHITWADDALRNVVAPGGEDPWFQRYKNFFPNIQTDIQHMQLYEGDEGDNYLTEGKQGCMTWWAHKKTVILNKALELNRTATIHGSAENTRK